MTRKGGLEKRLTCSEIIFHRRKRKKKKKNYLLQYFSQPQNGNSTLLKTEVCSKKYFKIINKSYFENSHLTSHVTYSHSQKLNESVELILPGTYMASAVNIDITCYGLAEV